MDRLEKFWEELKKRNVVRAFLFYAVSAWLIIQFATATFPYLNFPPWAIQAVIITLLIGAPIVLIVSWIYELTTDGLKKTDSVDHEKSISVNTGKKLNQLTITVLSLAVVFLLIDKFYLSAPSENEVERTESIAVFPFSIQGSEDIQYLKDGMVDLISSKLDAMPGLNATDPNIILGVSNSRGLDNRNPVAAAEAAEELGANRVILGSITQVGDQLQVKISKYDNAGRPIGNTIIEDGTAAELYGRVDNIIRRLVADELNEQGSEFDSEAVLTTNKLESIVPFLQGMQLARVGRHEEALDFLKESVEADTNFVLGYHRYIENAGWIDGLRNSGRQETEFDPYFNRLEALSENLKGKNGEVVRASVAYLNSDITSERRFLNLLNKYGESVEILNGLAESIFHHRFMLAGNPVDAKPYFERLIEIDPTKDEYLVHLMQIIELEGDLDKFKEYAEKLNPESEQRYGLLFRQLMLQDSVSNQEISTLSKSLKDNFGFIATNKIDILEGIKIGRRAQEMDSKFNVSEGWFDFFERTLGGKHDRVFQEAFAQFDQSGALGGLLLFYFTQCSFDEIPIWKKYAKALIPMIESTTAQLKVVFPNLPPIELEYLLGLAHLYDNNLAETKSIIQGIRDQFDDETMTPYGKAQDQARLLYYNLSGILAYTEGDRDLAMAKFDSAETQVRRVSLDYASALSKTRYYHLAEYKIQDQDYEGALDIYLNSLQAHGFSITAIGFNWGFNVYRIAQMYDKLNEKDKAIAYYKKFLEAFQDPDEMYDAWVDDAYLRLANLINTPEDRLRSNMN